MNFQKFCDLVKDEDGQSISTARTLLIDYKNSSGEVFSVNPNDVYNFLNYIHENYNLFVDEWKKIQSRKEAFTNYEEKSYRAIYKLASERESLRAIGTAGKSQTKSLTMVITKLICFFSDGKYVSVEDNTFFDRDSISKLLSVGMDFSARLSGAQDKIFVGNQSKKMCLPKGFLLLAGISGTGKSRFVRKQAEASGSIDKTYKLISVRPDWHEPSDLLGYISRIKEEKYIVTDALKFMVSAWCDACDLDNTNKDYLANKPAAEMRTFWLCLDEMNLAPVEQYFADYLSVIETRKWEAETYSCDAILKADVIKLLGSTAASNLRKDLGLDDTKYKPLWSYFSEVGIPLPPNLIVAGTVNMDETTHGFSRKVIDRALTLDFGQFFPNEFDEFFEPLSNPVLFRFPTISQAAQSDFADAKADSDGQKSLEFLKGLNEILKGTMFELAYRALNELFISVICIKPKDDVALQGVWDDFLMTKVLPRIEGDDDKLRNHNDLSKKDILVALDLYVKKAFSTIYEAELRPDFFRVALSTDELVNIPCRSKAKLEWMITRLKTNGFTTFWP